MSEIEKTNSLDDHIVHSLVLNGDLTALAPAQRVDYYVYRCRLLGIDPAEKPFELLKLDGKLVLYAGKSCANALTRIHDLSVAVQSTVIQDNIVTVTARASRPSGRFTDDVAVIDLADISVVGGRNVYGKDIKGIGRPNAIMKAVTKAKRRAVLSLVGLGILDDTEVDSIRGAKRVSLDVESGEILDVDVVDSLGPRCSGDAQPLGDSIDDKCKRVGELMSCSPTAVLAAAMKLAGVDRAAYMAADGQFPSPWRISTEHGVLIRAALVSKLEELEGETEREPGDDPDEDGEPDDLDDYDHEHRRSNSDHDPTAKGAP